MSDTNLERYFARIGYDGPRTPSLATLRALHLAHALTIPFENLDVALGLEPSLALDALYEKLVDAGRGGYCFEHNLLLAGVLQRLGFSLRLLSARVQWNLPPEQINNRTHTLLRVEIDGAGYFADVGFGGLTMTAPLRHAPGEIQPTSHERFRVVALDRDGELQIQAEVQGSFVPLYRFDLQSQLPQDYELANHWIATSPRSPFTRMLMVARVTREARYALRDNAYAVHTPGGDTVRRIITDPEELAGLLQDPIGIRLPRGPAVSAVLARIAARTA
jgi:N-hydroxyarylamine O-acetyltransferase